MGKPVKELKFGPLARFDPRAFSKLIQGVGIVFRWSRALTCPCRLGETDQWDPGCPRCQGDGWLYVSPEYRENPSTSFDYIEVEAVFANVALEPTILEIFGHWTHGNALLTVQNEMRVGYRDRFIGMNQRMAWSELLKRLDQDEIPIGRYGRTTEDRLGAMRYEPIDVNYIEDDDGSGGRTVYEYGTDYTLIEATLTEPAKVSWVTGRGPPVDRLYTIHYECHPVWLVDDATYAVQHAVGPERGLTGKNVVQTLPTTFKVGLDYLTNARGT